MSEGVRFHLGAGWRHGSKNEPDQWEARDGQAGGNRWIVRKRPGR